MTSGDLPGGLTLNARTGTISGTPGASGTFSFTVEAKNEAGTDEADFSIAVRARPEKPVISAATPPNGVAGKPYSFTFTATGTQPITWSWSGTRPGGLTLNAATGAVTGTPEASGTFNFTVSATNSVDTATASFTIIIRAAPEKPVIRRSTLPNAIIGRPYSFALSATGTQPIAWSVTGNWPSGLRLDPETGVITGTPTEAGTYSFTVKAANESEDDDTLGMTLVVAAEPVVVDSGLSAGTRLMTQQYLEAMEDSAEYLDLAEQFINETPGLTGEINPGTLTWGLDPDEASAKRAIQTLSADLIDETPPQIPVAILPELTVTESGYYLFVVPLDHVSSGRRIFWYSDYPLPDGETGGDYYFVVSGDSGPVSTDRIVEGRPVSVVARLSTGTHQPLITVEATSEDIKAIKGEEVPPVVDGIPIDAAHFPDANFRSCVSAWDTNGDGALNEGEISEVTAVDVSSRGIASLEGIKFFTALEELNCSFNSLTGLDLSGCAKLTELNCSNNALTSLNLSGCTALKSLRCSSNRLTVVDVRDCALLTECERDAGTRLIGRLGIITRTSDLPKGTVGSSYSAPLEAAWPWEAADGVVWSLSGGKLPRGLSVIASGQISGAPEETGDFTFTVQAAHEDSVAPVTQELSITVENPPVTPPVISTTSLVGGYVGVSYSETLKAASETAVTWSLAGGALPDGLSLNASTGVISGRPTKTGTFNFTVKAANSGASAEKGLSIKIVTGTAPTIKTVSLPEGTAGKSYSATLTANGTKTITWSKSGSLPGGLTLSSAGKISGKPKAGGTYTFKVTAKNALGSNTKDLTLVIRDVKPVIKTGSLKNATVNKSYSATISATGTGLAWSVAGGALPSGVTLGKSTGKLSGKAKTAGTYKFTVKAENTAGSATKAYTLKVVETKPAIKTSTLKAATVGVSYSAVLSGTGTNIRWAWSGTRPAGLQLDASTGRVSGTPTKAATYKFSVTATNTGGSAKKTVKLVVNGTKPVIKTTSLKDGQLKTAYSVTLEATETDLKWTRSAGKLPTGLKLSAAGKITGTPTKAGTFNFTVKAANKKNSRLYATKKLSIRIVRQTKAGTSDAMEYGPDETFEMFNDQNSGTGTPDAFEGRQDAATPDGETDAGIIPDENLDRAELMVLSGDEALDGDMIEVVPDRTVTFAIGPWTDADGNDVEVTNLKVYVADEPYAVDVDADTDRFTLPESLFTEGSEFSVYVTAEAGGQLLKSREVYLIVWDGPANVPSAAQTNESRNDSRSGCDAVGLGALSLILSAAFFLRRRQK